MSEEVYKFYNAPKVNPYIQMVNIRRFHLN